MRLQLERIYQQPQNTVGYRILVDRLWPRGISKVNAHLDYWFKDIAPSNKLRSWFNHEPQKFPVFAEKYNLELQANPKTPQFIQLVQQHLKTEDVILLYGAKDQQHNQAVVLYNFVKQQLK